MKILNTSLELTETKQQGFWLYDNARSMNVAMNATSEIDAYQRALQYYATRLPLVEKELTGLRTKVNNFVVGLGDD